MDQKLLIAGAIVAAAAICALAAAGLALTQGQSNSAAPAVAQAGTSVGQPSPVPSAAPEFSSVSGGVVSSMGSPIGGVPVTLHLMALDGTAEGARELYNLTTTTKDDQPNKGTFIFDNVEIPPEQKYAYVSAEVSGNDITYYGMTDNFTLNASETAQGKFIVMHLPPELVNGS